MRTHLNSVFLVLVISLVLTETVFPVTLGLSARELGSLAQAPTCFTKNVGQWPDSILFRTEAGVATAWLTRDGIWYQYTRHVANTGRTQSSLSAALKQEPNALRSIQDSVEIAMLKAEFVGRAPSTQVLGQNELPFKCNYFIGSDPGHWRQDVPTYSSVVLKGLYPGVDATFNVESGSLRCDLTGNSVDVGRVRVAYRGGQGVTSRKDGLCAVSTSTGIRLFNGAVPVNPSVEVPAKGMANFADVTGVPLVYSTLIGGADYDCGQAVAVDDSGYAYVTGMTHSSNFPTLEADQVSFRGESDVFVTKVSASGNGLIFSTYVGGSAVDVGNSIAVDRAGQAVVTGYTYSPDFPTFNAPQQTFQGGEYDAFVTKLSASGDAVIYSTYLGGTDNEAGGAITVDADGNAFVTGYTASPNFPTQNPYQSAFQYGGHDAFVTKIASSGTALLYSTLLGADGDDEGWGIAVDASGCAYVAGYTGSSDFPTVNPYQAGFHGGANDAFVTKFSASGNSLLYSTYLGGGSNDWAAGIAVDRDGAAYLVGTTWSTDFPIQNPLQASHVGDAFVTKLSPAGSSLVYSTDLGGSGTEYGYSISVDVGGEAAVVGVTESSDFPTRSPLQATFQGGPWDAFVSKISDAGDALVFSTYLGGAGYETGFGVTEDNNGNTYITGQTGSSNFPLQNSFQGTMSGWDVFVTKLAGSTCCIGKRGDMNGSGVIDSADLAALVSYLSGGGYKLSCIEAANVNGLGIVDSADLTALVSYLTGGGFVPPNCP